MKTTRNIVHPVFLFRRLLPVIVGLLCASPAWAVMVTWEGTNGVSANLNWSSPANWYQINTFTEISPVANAANFTWTTAVSTPGLTTVNVDGAYNSPGSGFAQSYGGFFSQTNGYHTVVINPGVIWSIQASGSAYNNGTQGIGIEVGPQQTNNNNINNYYAVSTPTPWTNYTTITGIGGMLYCDAGANTGGLRVEGASTVVNNHYSILDMSGLGTFYMTNITGLSSSCGFYIVNGGANSQALIYLALTNTIALNNDFQVGYLGSSSNSLPIGVYLGQTNYITTGANSNYMIIGYTGCTNAFMKFNPNLAGSMPTVFITGTGGAQNAFICSAAGGNVPGYAVCDFTLGSVRWLGGNLTMGVAGTAASGSSANGVLSFNNGLVSFNNITVGDQSVSAGSAGTGQINVGSNAFLIASNLITLGAVTGVANPATMGVLNINGGTLQASAVTNGGAGSAINTTNGHFNFALVSTAVTNVLVSNFNAGGPTNIINISSIPLFLSGNLPLRFHLISTAAAGNLVGAATLGLGTLPTSPNPYYSYAGYIDTTTTPGLVDFVLTAAPPSVRSLTWTGTNAGSPDGNWDVSSSYDWETNGVATYYNQLDLANFFDVASPAQTSVSLTTELTPSSVTVSNNNSLYTIGLNSDSGYLAGSTGLTKEGSGTLILDDDMSNAFTGPVIISGGTLQIGNGDTDGNLPGGVVVVDDGVLAYDRADDVVVGNAISGTGQVISEGGGQLKLSSGNTFTGDVIVTNGSILQSGATTSLGSSTNATMIVGNGSTYDPNGFATARAIIVSGNGVNGEGAIVNSGGPIYDSSAALTPSLTLAGNTTFSFPTRWDYGYTTGTAVLSTGGQPYNLTLNGTGNDSYFEWRDVAADPALANIDVTAGYFGIVGTTTLGNTTSSTLTVEAFANIKLYNVSSTQLVVITKPLVMHGSSFLLNEDGSNTIAGPLTLLNDNSGYVQVDAVAPSLTISGPLSGSGILWESGSTGPLIITGNASAFTGGALISSGSLELNSIFGSGITNAANTILYGNGVAEGYVDCSGMFLPGNSNVVGTFSAADGLTMESSSSLLMNLSSTTNVGGSHNSLVQVTGNLTINGSPTIYINPIGTLVDGTYTLINYSGTLSGSFGAVQTVAPSSYSLTLTNTAGAVQLVVNGAPTPGEFTSFTLSGATLTLGGSGGLANGTYRVYTATNLATPLSNWTEVGNGSFDGSGDFTFPTTVSTNGAAQFFILEEP